MRRLLPLLLALAPAALAGQSVVVAPHLVHIDHRGRTGSMIVYNPGTGTVEIEVGTAFGYPASDSAGRTYLRLQDAPEPGEPSAAGWVSAFPRRTTLGPGERQVVRLLARPPADLADGEYWARLVVRAVHAAPPPAPEAAEGVRVGLSLEVRTILALVYRKGAVTTGVRLGALTAAPAGDSLHVNLRLDREGTAAYLGLLAAELHDSTGRVVAADTAQVAVYRHLTPRYVLPLAGLLPGHYTLVVTVHGQRDDVPDEARLPSAPVTDTVAVALP